MKGNARYVEGVSRRHDFKHEREPLAQGQNPFAAVLSCADSRIAPEFCFDTARGDVFVCRHAGNFADEETIASFEYGVAVLNVPLLMVLGLERLRCHRFHHQIDQGQHHPARPSAGASARLTPAVQAAQGKPSDLPANAIRANVAMKVDRLKTTAPILKAAVDDNKLRVVGGVYSLKTGRVDLL
jgi:carbonic anhydrase